jgi:hypothetical protein
MARVQTVALLDQVNLVSQQLVGILSREYLEGHALESTSPYHSNLLVRLQSVSK